MPAIGLFDLDGSLADHDAAILRDLKAIASPGEPEPADMWTDIAGADHIPHMKARLHLIRSQPGWWYDLQPIQFGLDVFQEAKAIGFCCQVLTKGPKTKPLAWTEKLKWCHYWLGEEHLVHITMDKGLVYGKFLYDDYPEYMLRWLSHRPRGLGIIPVRENNKDFKHPNVIMYDGHNLKEVRNALQRCYDRKPGEELRL